MIKILYLYQQLTSKINNLVTPSFYQNKTMKEENIKNIFNHIGGFKLNYKKRLN